jgi:hypothetical protein
VWFYKSPANVPDPSPYERALAEQIRDIMFGMDDKIDITRLRDTHGKIGTIREDAQVEEVFSALQGENWSPEGEAKGVIVGAGVRHTSMSVGDLLRYPNGEIQMVAPLGFKKIEPPEKIGTYTTVLAFGQPPVRADVPIFGVRPLPESIPCPNGDNRRELCQIMVNAVGGLAWINERRSCVKVDGVTNLQTKFDEDAYYADMAAKMKANEDAANNFAFSTREWTPELRFFAQELSDEWKENGEGEKFDGSLFNVAKIHYLRAHPLG